LNLPVQIIYESVDCPLIPLVFDEIVHHRRFDRDPDDDADAYDDAMSHVFLFRLFEIDGSGLQREMWCSYFGFRCSCLCGAPNWTQATMNSNAGSGAAYTGSRRRPAKASMHIC
jgi:hypothetical protein